MTRLAIGAVFGVMVGIIGGAALGTHAQTDKPGGELGTAAQCSRDVNGCTEHPELLDDVRSAAAEADVNVTDLLGAVNVTGMEPRAYLCAADGVLCPVIAPVISRGYPARVRLTHYVEYGVTYGGGHPYAGSTACSWNFALGTRFVLPDGETFTCNDRGLLGSAGWLDLWRRPDLSRAYGPFATVQVIP